MGDRQLALRPAARISWSSTGESTPSIPARPGPRIMISGACRFMNERNILKSRPYAAVSSLAAVTPAAATFGSFMNSAAAMRPPTAAV